MSGYFKRLWNELIPPSQPQPLLPRCPWLAVRAQCFREAGHPGLCEVHASRQYRGGEWKPYVKRYYGINYLDSSWSS